MNPSLSFRSKWENHLTGWRLCEILLILAAGFMAYLLIGRPACDGNFGRHCTHGEQNLLAGRILHSNAPPFPLMDLFHGALMLLTPKKIIQSIPVLNIAAFLTGGMALILFFFILHEYRNEGLDLTGRGALAFMAVHPIFIVAAGTTGDYGVSLTALLGAWFCVLRGELAGGAALTGIAAGLRISNCLWAIPLAFLTGRKWGASRVAGYLLAATCVGFLAYLGDLMLVHFDIMKWTGALPDALPWINRFKSSISAIAGLIGIPTLLITLLTCRSADYRRSLALMNKFPELPLILAVEYSFFTVVPFKLGYIISTLPVLALILPQPQKPIFTYLRILLLFSMNFVVFDFQNKIPTKFHLCSGYYVLEYTCHDANTVLEHFRFSLPRGPYYPIADWTESPLPPGRRY